MWKAYVSGSYFILEQVNGNLIHRRKKENVEVRKPTKNSTLYIFNDVYDTYAEIEFANLVDVFGNPFSSQAAFESMVNVSTGQASLCCGFGTPISDAQGGFISINVQDAELDLSNPPDLAYKALIQVDASKTSSAPTKAFRYTENDTSPTDTFGFFLGDGDFVVVENNCLDTFSFIAGVVGEPVTIHVQFYYEN